MIHWDEFLHDYVHYSDDGRLTIDFFSANGNWNYNLTLNPRGIGVVRS